MTVCVPTIRDSVGITASSAQAHHGTPRCIQWPLVHVWWTPCGVVQKNSVATPISRQPGVVATVETNNKWDPLIHMKLMQILSSIQQHPGWFCAN